MKNRCYQLFIFSILFLFGFNLNVNAAVYTLQNLSNPKDDGTGYVANPDGTLSSQETQQLNTEIARMETELSVQIALVIVQSIGRENPKIFASDLFNKWGVGQKGKDNGLLILTVMDQRRTEFEVGYGLEPFLTDAQCYRIGVEQIVPNFKQGEFGKGLLAALQKTESILRKTDPEEDAVSPSVNFTNNDFSPEETLPFFAYFLLCGFVGFWYFYTIRQCLNDKKDLYDKYLLLRKKKKWLLILLFPIPYLAIYIFLTRKLKTLRYAPRYSKIDGELLTIVPQENEHIYLERGQIVEEQIGSAEYDVWAAASESDILILRYDITFDRYDNCPSCGYETYYKARSYTVVTASRVSAGSGINEYHCKNCNFMKRVPYSIPRLPPPVSSGRSRGGSSSWKGGSSSSGSSSWGGGSSGGGGGGVSW